MRYSILLIISNLPADPFRLVANSVTGQSQRLWIPVQCQEVAVATDLLQDPFSMSPSAGRAIDQAGARPATQEPDRFPHEYRFMEMGAHSVLIQIPREDRIC